MFLDTDIPDAALPRKAYPTSAKNKVDWDRLAQEADKEKEDSSDINSLFKQLYKDATDEQRQAMIKSYQESGGTALSTDWGDVKDVSFPLAPSLFVSIH